MTAPDKWDTKYAIADLPNSNLEVFAGVNWKQRLHQLIVQSLRENAKAGLEVESTPGQGTRVKITFKRSEVTSEKST